jgi:type II secretory pathway pseudopilin PulG
MRCLVKNRGQVWVETVIYTLIGLAIIGLVLAVALPKVNQKKDEILINNAIGALGDINDKIYEVRKAVGNRRQVDVDIGKGKVVIDMDEDTISWVLSSSYEYSEEGLTISQGRIDVTTTKASPWEVELLMNYSVDLQYNGQTTGTKELSSAAQPYGIQIENEGVSPAGNIVIILREA